MNPSWFLMLSLVPGNPPTAPVPPVWPMQAGPNCPPGSRAILGQPCPPIGPPAPVLAIKLLGPAGSRVQWLPGTNAPTQPTPATAAVRPGYRYVAALSQLPGRDPAVTVYPVLEVLGSLAPRTTMNPMEYPAPFALSEADVQVALSGGLVTKFIYLEDPTKAVPVAAKPDQPLEFTDLNERDAEAAARANGRLVAILRLGDRAPDPEQLAGANWPGTLWLPGQDQLAAPARGPCLPAVAIPLYDPILGPKIGTEECVTDGNDKGDRLGIGPGQKLGGLNPTDVALEYTVNGKRRVATSNEVCICAPRFVLRKVDRFASGVDLLVRLDASQQIVPVKAASMNRYPGGFLERYKPQALEGRLRPALTFVVQGVAQMEALQKPMGLATVLGVQQSIGVIEPGEITSNLDQFVVHKQVEPVGPLQSGDEVTFTLNYRNSTRHPATDIILSDSLSGRLEYVQGSAQSDRPANITTLENEAGSVVVRFDIPGPIPPGKTGVVKFRAKVR